MDLINRNNCLFDLVIIVIIMKDLKSARCQLLKLIAVLVGFLSHVLLLQNQVAYYYIPGLMLVNQQRTSYLFYVAIAITKSSE